MGFFRKNLKNLMFTLTNGRQWCIILQTLEAIHPNDAVVIFLSCTTAV